MLECDKVLEQELFQTLRVIVLSQACQGRDDAWSSQATVAEDALRVLRRTQT